MWNWKFQLSNHRLGSLGNQPPPWGCPGAPSHLISKTCTTWEIPSSRKQGRDQIRISYMTDTYHFQVFFLNLGLDLGAVSERITKKAGWSGWCLWIIIIFLKRCERIGIHFTKSKWIFFFLFASWQYNTDEKEISHRDILCHTFTGFLSQWLLECQQWNMTKDLDSNTGAETLKKRCLVVLVSTWELMSIYVYLFIFFHCHQQHCAALLTIQVQ